MTGLLAGLRRRVRYHHVLIVLLTVSIILASILVAGCTTESLSGIYLVSLSYTGDDVAISDFDGVGRRLNTSPAPNGTSLEVRAGYFGMCASAAGQWACSRTPEALASFADRLLASGDGAYDPLNIIYAAERFRGEIVFVGLLLGTIVSAFFAVLLLLTFPTSHTEVGEEGSDREVKVLPSRHVTYVVLAFAFISSVLGLLSGFWQHLSSSAAATTANIFTYGAVAGRVGAGAMVLGWLSVFFLVIVFIGLLVMIMSIRALFIDATI